MIHKYLKIVSSYFHDVGVDIANISAQYHTGYCIDTSRASNRTYATVHFTSKLLEKPLLRENLQQDPILQHLMVIRVPNSISYKVTPQE